jgi:hypothetical protein
MIAIEFLEILSSSAKKYAKNAQQSVIRNSHMNNLKDPITQDQIDAVLVDFINYIASSKWYIDYAMYTTDLYNEDQLI